MKIDRFGPFLKTSTSQKASYFLFVKRKCARIEHYVLYITFYEIVIKFRSKSTLLRQFNVLDPNLKPANSLGSDPGPRPEQLSVKLNKDSNSVEIFLKP